MIPELPTDIWLQVIQFIPEDELDQLLSLNSLFLHVVLKKRYEHVRISNAHMEKKKSMNYIRRLNDPFVGQLVENFSLRLEFSLIAPRSEYPKLTWSDRIQNKVSKVIRRRPTTVPAPVPSNCESQWFDEIRIIFPRLVNLQKFAVHLYCAPTWVDCESFFEPAWQTFGARLPKLSLGGDIDSVRRIAVAKPHLPALKNLSMEFIHHSQEDTARGGLSLAQDIAPFLNILAPQLQSFRLWCWGKFDLSAFLKSLKPFPHLNGVSVRGHFDNAFQNDGSGMTIFLRQMPALRNLELRLNPQRAGLEPETERPLAQYLISCTSDAQLFRNLQSLQIYPTNRPEGINIILNSIERSLYSLTSLTVRDRYLDLEEVARVIPALKNCTELLYLRMNLRTLDIDIFDMLSKCLPHLRQLSLYLTDNFGASENMRAFLDAVQERQYMTWELTDLGLWQGASEIEQGSMDLIAQRIPSVKSFWGTEAKHLLPITIITDPFPSFF
ncbi:hypothetical protein JOM56_013906 [Amanita muscaria]